MRFRMAEDLTDPNLSAILKFKVTGLAEGDEFEVALNGEVIPADQFEHTFDDERGPPFYLYHTPLGSPPAKFGDNELRVRLAKSVVSRLWNSGSAKLRSPFTTESST